MIKGSSTRRPQQPIVPLLLDRWSPRAMDGTAVSPAALARLLEAARWAPSSMNHQPWRFLYALRGGAHWSAYLDFLRPGNRSWCEQAGALMVFLAKRTLDDGSPSPTHAFDTGAAWQNFALQGYADGLVVHGMRGFDAERVRRTLGVPDSFGIEAMAAVGHPGELAMLPERFRARETPSDRKPVAELAHEGLFAFRG